MDKLLLGHGHRPGTIGKNSAGQFERHYIDFIVSGLSLGKLLGLPKTDLIGTFGWTDNVEYELTHIKEFSGFGPAELESGRTCFYVCPECGDIGCGAITAKIEFIGNEVIWKNFGHEGNSADPDLEDFQHIGPFVFERDSYLKVLKQLHRR